MPRTIRMRTISMLIGVFQFCLLNGVAAEDTSDEAADQPASSTQAAVSGNNLATAQVGDLATQFECIDDEGNLWTSHEHVGNQYLVVFFYKSDFSFCCERQAKQYRGNLEALTDLCAEVVGISGDSVKSHSKFASTRQFNFPLLSDRWGQVATQFDVPFRKGGKAMETDACGNTVFDCCGKAICHPRNVTPEHRCTFIIDTEGRIIYRAENVSPMEDARAAINFIQSWNANPQPLPRKCP